MRKITYKPIGIIHTPFKNIKGMPNQPTAGKDVEGIIERGRKRLVRENHWEDYKLRGEKTRKSKAGIPVQILKEIFPKKLGRSLASDRVYSHLKQMIVSGKLRKGQRLLREKIAQKFNVSENAVSISFAKLKKDGLVIIKHGAGSFVA